MLKSEGIPAGGCGAGRAGGMGVGVLQPPCPSGEAGIREAVYVY
jgi:hypothetical protein